MWGGAAYRYCCPEISSEACFAPGRQEVKEGASPFFWGGRTFGVLADGLYSFAQKNYLLYTYNISKVFLHRGV